MTGTPYLIDEGRFANNPPGTLLPTGHSEDRPARPVRDAFNRNSSPAETVPVLIPDAPGPSTGYLQ